MFINFAMYRAIRPLASYHEKLYKLDEPDTQDTAGEARTSS